MKYIREIEMNAPRDQVAKLFGDPANRMKWMDGIESFEQMEGAPGDVWQKRPVSCWDGQESAAGLMFHKRRAP